MKTTTLTKPQRAVLTWLTEDGKRTLRAYTNDKGAECFHGVVDLHGTLYLTLSARGLKAKRLIEQAGIVGECTAYRISAKGRKVLKYNQDKRP